MQHCFTVHYVNTTKSTHYVDCKELDGIFKVDLDVHMINTVYMYTYDT